MSYDPQSIDSMFSRIMERQDTQDHTLTQILAEVRRTNGRVNALETARAVSRGQIAMISFLISGIVGISGFLISIVLGFIHP